MADPIVHPPMACCSCYFCTKRRHELQLVERLERELLVPALPDLLPTGEPWAVWRKEAA